MQAPGGHHSTPPDHRTHLESNPNHEQDDYAVRADGGGAGLASLAPSPARADLIDVQFNTSGTATYSGAAVLGAAGDVWNAFGQNTESGASGSGSLVRSDGTASGVTLSYSTPTGFYDASGNGAIFNGTPYSNLMSAYLFGDIGGFFAGPGTVSFAGLTPGDS